MPGISIYRLKAFVSHLICIYLQYFKVAPSRCSIHLLGIDDRSYEQDKIDFWKDVYGFDFSVLQENNVHEDCQIDVVNPETVITTAIHILVNNMNVWTIN